MWQSIKQNFILERYVTIVLAIMDFQLLTFLIKEERENPVLVTFLTIRILFVIVAYVFYFVRASKRYYVPVLREMPKRLYWQYTSFIFLSMKSVVFTHFLPSASPTMSLIEFGLTVGIIGRILISFQSRSWALPEYEKRQRLIRKFAKKAELSKQELLAISPTLIEVGRTSQRKPVAWSITEILIGLIIAASISSYASYGIELLNRNGFQLRNLLPPY